MSLKNEVAAVLRALRHVHGAGYAHLSDHAARRTIGELERAGTGVTLDKLASVAQTLGFDLPTFVALCDSLQRGVEPEQVIGSMASQIEAFRAAGGIDLMQSEISDGVIVKRPRGKPRDHQAVAEIRRLKAEGRNQSEAARELGIPRSTVQTHWHD
ncbi:Cro/Cl family transcriptional regulator [Pseudomonas sp. BLCC-B112]|uniref:Cro/Cl family transcriptional regulator n=1 Tax=Pseudomonas sp. BLCC-B112 TaxID=3025319 RepID=UPI00234C6EEB|nr:Cro/Cl family transcriptional regulator [Pseudomonas sp. BLCC-B112]MDC7815654.1 Cro/Cl family transcriptional regulator [Pseudomonas sp. BLCC-B112]